MHRVVHRCMQHFGAQRGFTLFEIVMVLLIMGVISYFVATRLFSDSAPAQYAELELLKNHLRYAQSRALNTDTNWGIEFDLTDPNQSKYRLYYEDASSSKKYVLLPADETYHSTNYKIAVKQLIITSVTNSSNSNETRFFCGSANSAKPGYFGSPSLSDETKDMMINTSAGPITIAKNTGFIP